MARLARADVFDPLEVSTFHCINRCVRRCFLLGDDPLTGRNYDHRKDWLEERLQFLAGQFGIDVLAFSILSNHFHLIVRNRPDVVATWSDTEVAQRWLRLSPPRKQPDGQPADPTEAELDSIRCLPDKLAIIRRRLSDIS
ncbi:MAG: transposase, partial [Planctomycetes bacterium]|nr:transposase [Planctomycetota bacterium]